MAFSELPLHHSFRLSARPHLCFFPLRLLSSSRPASSPSAAAAASPSSGGNRTAPPAQSNGSPWLKKWGPTDPSQPPPAPAPSTSIDRIVHRLRNLGLGTDDDEPSAASTATAAPPEGNERLGDLLDRSWARPDRQFAASSFDEAVLPWERDAAAAAGRGDEEDGAKRRRVKAPTLAELTIEDEELRRLRRMGMTLRDRITVPKAGVTQAVVEKIHDAWRKSELVRLKFHEDLAHDMKTAHELVEVCIIHIAHHLFDIIEYCQIE
jgi:RNA-binding protein YhbY